MLCTGHREFGTNRWRFPSKANTLYFRLCKTCEFMMCILIVNHQLIRMHPWCSWECMLPGRCSPGKRCHIFWNRNIVLLPIVLGEVSCVPENGLLPEYFLTFHLHYISFALHYICIQKSCHVSTKCMTCHDLNVMHYICIS